MQVLKINGLAMAACAVALSCAASAATLMSDSADLAGETLPEGWSAAGSSLVSPAFGNPVARVAVEYGPADAAAPGEWTLYATNAATGAEEKVAELNALTSAAQFDFPADADYRAFRLETNGVALASFTASWFAPMAVSGSLVARTGYVEHFHSLTNIVSDVVPWADFATVPFWQARSGASVVETIKRKTGWSNQSAGLYAYHSVSNKNDHDCYSLAEVANTQTEMAFGFAVENDTDVTLSDFSLSFKVRQWTFSKDRNTSVPHSLRFAFLVTNAVVAVSDAGDWREVEALKFDAVASLAAAEGVETLTRNKDNVSAVLSSVLDGVSLKKGEVLMFRWKPNGVSKGEVFGVDDVVLTCAEPSSSTGLAVYLVKSP